MNEELMAAVRDKTEFLYKRAIRARAMADAAEEDYRRFVGAGTVLEEIVREQQDFNDEAQRLNGIPLPLGRRQPTTGSAFCRPTGIRHQTVAVFSAAG
jgi:hypothetical protein